MSDRQQQGPSTIKINSELVKKIKQFIETNPNADESKVIDTLVNDSTLRLKKEVIKSGVNQYWRKYVVKPQNGQTKNGTNNSVNNKPPIDLTLQTIRKKVKKSQQSYEFQDNEAYKFDSMGGVGELKQQLNETIFQYANNRVLYN